MPLPEGIQALLNRAATDPEFRDLLLSQRAEAAAAIGLALHDSEKRVLAEVPAEQLAKMIDQTRDSLAVPPPAPVPEKAFDWRTVAGMISRRTPRLPRRKTKG